MFNMIEALFAPGRRHTDEERRRLELTRVDLNDGDPGRGPIDLESGKVVVRVPEQPEPAATNAPHRTLPADPGSGRARAAAPDPDPGGPASIPVDLGHGGSAVAPSGFGHTGRAVAPDGSLPPDPGPSAPGR